MRWGRDRVTSRLRSGLAHPATPVAALSLVIVAANLVYLAGITNPNPINYNSGLISSIGPRYLPGLNYVDPNVGTTAQALGHLAALSWLHGHVPWWNYYEALGTPLAGEMQGAALFPLVLLDWFSTGQVWFRLVLELGTAVTTYLLMRRLVRSRWAAFAGGAAFGLNGTYSWMFHSPANPVLFLPMLILGIEQAQDRSRRLAGVALIAVAVALSLYAGSPEVAYIDGLLGALWFVLRVSERHRAELATYVGRVAGGVGVGVLLAAPVLVAFGTFLQEGTSGSHDTGSFAHAHLAAGLALPDLILPYVFGPIIGWLPYDRSGTLAAFWGSVGGYLGMSVVLLGLIGLVGSPHRRLRIGLGAWVVLAVGRTVGVPVLQTLVNGFPEVARTAFYRYAPPSVTLAVVVLAVFGIDDVARSRRWRVVVPVGLLCLLGALLAFRRARQVLDQVHGAPGKSAWANSSIGFALAVVVLCGAAALLPRTPRARAGILSGVVVFESLAMFVVPQLSTPTGATIDTGPVTFLSRHLGGGRFMSLGPIGADYGSYFEVASINANDGTVAKTYASYVKDRLDPVRNPLIFVRSKPATFATHLAGYEEAGVKYVVTSPGMEIPTPPGVDLPVVYQDQTATIRQLPDVAPLFSAQGGACRVVSSTLARARAECRSPGVLVYREQYLRGWIAVEDRHVIRPAPYRKVFQQIPLHPGANSVRFSFTPPHTGWGQAGLAAGGLLLAGTLVWPRTRGGAVGGRQMDSEPPESRGGSLETAVMEAADWDNRYAGQDLVWSAEPNRFVEEECRDLPPGRALDLAAGEGRNAIWLAGRGWTVTAVDFSSVAIEKGRRLAEAQGAEVAGAVTWMCEDVRTWSPPAGAFDLVLVAYLHIGAEDRRRVLAAATAALAPGGTLLVVGHDLANLTDGVGGPQEPSVLYRPEDLVADLVVDAGQPEGLVVEEAGTRERPTPAGTALDALVRVRRTA